MRLTAGILHKEKSQILTGFAFGAGFLGSSLTKKSKANVIRNKAADALFGFSMRKKDYAKAEEYLAYFSDYDPVKKLNRGRWHMEQGEAENAYKLFEEVIFTEYNRSSLALAYMVGMALEKMDYEKARYYAKKQGEIACAFEMGIYQQCSPMLEIVCAQKDVKGTCQVVEQLLNHVESLYESGIV
jgi:tetratricopeptide (TPR) repeat protein